jgi:cytochrome c oxidase subunit 2
VVAVAETRQALDMGAEGQRKSAEHGCLRCHSVDGSRHIGPTWAGLYGREVLLSDGARVVADEAYLTQSMMDPGRRLHQGYQNLMPVYLGLLPPGDTAAIVEYIRSLRAVRPQEGAQ